MVSTPAFGSGSVSLRDPRVVAGVDHELDRVGQREDQGPVGGEHAVNLPKDAGQVGDRGKGVHGDGGVEAVGWQERQRRQFTSVELHVNAGGVDVAAGPFELTSVGIDGDDARTMTGQCDRPSSGSAPQDEHAPFGHVSEESSGETVDRPRPELEIIVGPGIAIESGGRVAGPWAHGARV